MNRFRIAFFLAVLVHGLGIYALTSVRTQSPQVNVKQGRASMKMAFQTASAAPEPTESEQQDEKPEKKKETSQPTEVKDSAGNKRSSVNSKQSEIKGIKEKQENQDNTGKTENRGSEEQQDTKGNAGNLGSEGNREKERKNEENKENQVKEESKEKQQNHAKNEKQVPESVDAEGVEWVQDVDYRENPPPKYPTKARVLGVEGTVRLLVTIDAQGNPESVKVHEESGSYRLDEAARRAVRDWEFVPTKDNGQPARSKTIVPVTFSLEGR